MKIFLSVKPAAKENKIEKIDSDSYKVWVKEPAEKGRSNRAIVKNLAEYFKVPAGRVKILAGHTSRSKIVEVDI